MTKNKNTHTLLIVGGLAAVVALGAAVLLHRPTAPAGETGTGGSFWEKIPTFSVHNGLDQNGYGSLVDRWVGGILPGNPLAPVAGGYYGPSFSDKYSYTSPPSTSSAADAPSAFTPAGGSGATGGGFGVRYP